MGTLRAGGVCDVSVVVPVHWPSQTVPGVGGSHEGPWARSEFLGCPDTDAR